MGGITAKFKLFSHRDACHERPRVWPEMRAYVTAAAWIFAAGHAGRPSLIEIKEGRTPLQLAYADRI
jgi:hypothetical protein